MKLLPNLIATSLLLASSSAMANFHVNVGAISVMPNDDSSYLNTVETLAGLPVNSTQVSVDSNTQLGLTFDYDIDDNWTVELVAATPFSHDIEVKSTASAVNKLAAGSTKHLPPTLLMQYHFGSKEQAFRPFVGAGINYTIFFEEEVSGLDAALTGLDIISNDDHLTLDLDDSVGLALQAGFNYSLNKDWGIHAMASWADIDSDGEVKLNGNTIQKIDVQIDPTIVMVGLRYSFN
ncbi:OmpW/AlkL family protein [Flocculibacter collagenilyticus]|uniref:OmpW/AlkL family protein n=1 Tax=Flocculibacter collagenilyticus TaxID=2744479 RepID=UPI0018F57ECC|nr:OmpW family outer membrane protein [Flocculibacter collagenilyticus]